MADILIRGREMPENCLFCPCSFWDERTLALWCQALSTYDDNLVAENVTAVEAHGGKPPKAKRPEWCPLVELPEHGDLIDSSKIVLEYAGLARISLYDFIGTADYFADQIKRQPVIVPANREGTK